MDILSIGETSELSRIRFGEKSSDIQSLLNVIDILETRRVVDKMPILRGWCVSIYGRYAHSDVKADTFLQFFVINDSYDDDKIMEQIRAQHGNNLLSGFTVSDYSMVAVNKTVILTGTGVCAK